MQNSRGKKEKEHSVDSGFWRSYRYSSWSVCLLSVKLFISSRNTSMDSMPTFKSYIYGTAPDDIAVVNNHIDHYVYYFYFRYLKNVLKEWRELGIEDKCHVFGWLVHIFDLLFKGIGMLTTRRLSPNFWFRYGTYSTMLGNEGVLNVYS